jgi:predicted dehydrogenase
VTSPIRIAVIGAGAIGRRHIGVIRAHADFALAGIAEVNTDAARAAFPDIPVEADAADLLDRVKPDAVIVASPNQLHLAHGALCAARGIPFILEKPVAHTVDAAAELSAIVRQAGVATLVGHHRRHHLQVIETRRLLAEGAIGTIIGVSGIWATRKPDPYFVAGPWRRQTGGGPVLINLIHEIDLLRLYLGEIDTVSAVVSNRQRGFEVEDTAAMVLTFASGAIGTFLMSDAAVSPWTMEQGTGEVTDFPFSGASGYRFVGTAGALESPGMILWSQKASDPDWNKPIVAQALLAGRRDPYPAQLDHFRDVVRGKAASIQTVDDASRTLVATLAVREAAAAGVTVRIADRLATFGVGA